MTTALGGTLPIPTLSITDTRHHNLLMTCSHELYNLYIHTQSGVMDEMYIFLKKKKPAES